MLYAGLLFISVLLISLSKPSSQVYIKVMLSGYAQGTTWHASYYAVDSLVKQNDIDSILLVIDSSLSIYKPYSHISAFNNSRSGALLDGHFRKVVEKSLDTYHQTHGLFDITVLPLVEAWGFGAKTPVSIPDSATIRSLKACVGSNFLQLKNNRLCKNKPCIRIDVNGIAQGYSVDVVAAFFEQRSIINYIIEIGGELRVHGKKQPLNEPFKVGIETPSDNNYDYTQLLEKILVIDSGAITTSGNYRKYHESKGKRISHLIDPRTGYSVQNELISVTVYAADGITADAYDNALMLMGVDSALKFVEQRKDLAAFFIYKSPAGAVTDTASSRFYKLIQP